MISISAKNSIFLKWEDMCQTVIDWGWLERWNIVKVQLMWHEYQFTFDTQSAQVNERAHVINVH